MKPFSFLTKEKMKKPTQDLSRVTTLRTRSTSQLLPRQAQLNEFVTIEEISEISRELQALEQPQDSLALEQQLKFMRYAIRVLQNYHSSYTQ